MTRYRTIFWLSVLSILLAACAAPPSQTIQPEPTSTVTTAPAQPAESNQTGQCLPDQTLLDQFRSVLPYEQAVLVQEAFAGERTLIVWFVDPTLEPALPELSAELAAVHAVEALRNLYQASACLSEFQIVHVNVVDSQYNQMFSAPIRFADIPPLVDSGSGGGPNEQSGGGRAEITPAPLLSPPKGACAWMETSLNLSDDLAKREISAAFYFIRDPGGSIIYAQWSVVSTENVLSALQELENIYNQIACLYPQPTGLSLTLTSPAGMILLTGFLSLDLTGNHPFNLNDFSYTIIE